MRPKASQKSVQVPILTDGNSYSAKSPKRLLVSNTSAIVAVDLADGSTANVPVPTYSEWVSYRNSISTGLAKQSALWPLRARGVCTGRYPLCDIFADGTRRSHHHPRPAQAAWSRGFNQPRYRPVPNFRFRNFGSRSMPARFRRAARRSCGREYFG